MTKDKKKNFSFKSERQKAMVFAYIRELKQKELTQTNIINLVKKEFKLDAHIRTVEGWIKKQSCRHSELWRKEQALVEKWRKELEEPKTFLSPEEIQLEEMFNLAKVRGIQV